MPLRNLLKTFEKSSYFTSTFSLSLGNVPIGLCVSSLGALLPVLLFFPFARQPSGRRVTFLVLKADLVTHREMMLNGGRILMVVVQLKGLMMMTLVDLPIFLASPTARNTNKYMSLHT